MHSETLTIESFEVHFFFKRDLYLSDAYKDSLRSSHCRSTLNDRDAIKGLLCSNGL